MFIGSILALFIITIVTVWVLMHKGDGGANNATYGSVRAMRTKSVSPKRPVAANSVKIAVSVSAGYDEPPRPEAPRVRYAEQNSAELNGGRKPLL